MTGSVVRAQAWRRWGTVLAVLVVLCSVPIVINVWPARAATVDAEALRTRMAASVKQPFQGYAQSSGLLPLPALPNLEQVTDLVSTTTEMRVWYAARNHWRVDVLGPGTERDVYQLPGVQFIWDFGDSRVQEIVGDQPIRLPQAADVTPPELVRRLLGIAAGDPVEPLAGKRIAGIAAPGLRLRPGTADTTVDHVDVWADPGTGLPLQAEITAKGGTRPVFTTRFLELRLGPPPAAVLTQPAAGPGVGFSTATAPDVLGLINRRRPARLPASLAGSPRRDAVTGLTAAGVYGTGLAQFVVVALPGRFGAQAYDKVSVFGQAVDVPGGQASLIAAGLVSVLVVRAQRTYIVAGLVQPDILKRVAPDLAAVEP